MKSWMHRLYLKSMRALIERFDLIQPGDRVLVGVSGGKDSSLLFYALTQLQRAGIYPFEVEGLTVDHGMIEGLEAYKAYCAREGLTLNVHSEHYADRLSHDNPYNPCYTCSRLRKGIVKRYAKAHGFNKIAFGHTKDDLVETFMMNVLKHGKLAGMPPAMRDEVSELTLIRPLLYVPEPEIIKAVTILEIPLMKDTCTFAKKRTRSQAEALIQQIELTEPDFSDKIVQALHHIDDSRLLIK
ncbi:tRNA 2-thiocytidine biosynthesis TtcA family protein [Fusibacter sp. JL298sf-3]